MKKRFLNKLYLCVIKTVIAIAVCLPISADTPASITETDMLPPVTAAADTANEYGNRIGTDISVYEGNDEYYLFLPISAR